LPPATGSGDFSARVNSWALTAPTPTPTIDFLPNDPWVGFEMSTATLLRAAARARDLRGRVRVVKLGGSAMEDPAATRGTLESVAALQTLGVRLVLVHGGGKPIDRAMAASGLIPKKINGRRYTDAATLEIVVRVLRQINADLQSRLGELGGGPVGFDGVAGHPIRGERLVVTNIPGVPPFDLGHVGRPTQVNTAALEAAGVVPVLPSLAIGPDGGWLNVNADTAASAVAGALKAEACLFLTDTPGVLRSVSDSGSLIPRLTVAECRELIASGVIDGGMIPKVEACFEALEAGAGRAVILDGRRPHALLDEFVSDRIPGTEIVP
jgi:acetylglutamate kinase